MTPKAGLCPAVFTATPVPSDRPSTNDLAFGAYRKPVKRGDAVGQQPLLARRARRFRIAAVGNGQHSNAACGQRPREKAVIVDEVTVSEKEQHAGLVEFALAVESMKHFSVGRLDIYVLAPARTLWSTCGTRTGKEESTLRKIHQAYKGQVDESRHQRQDQ